MAEGKGVVGTSSECVDASVALAIQLGGTNGVFALTQPLGATLSFSGEPDAAGSTVQLDALSSEAIAALAAVPIDGLIFTEVDGDEGTPCYAQVEERIDAATVIIVSTQQERRLTNAALPPIDALALQSLFRKR
jgi:hypothetical protein